MKAILKLIIIYLLVFSVTAVMAQQANNWYFGYNAGLSFNTNPPTVLLDGALYSNEGCTSISDENGKLLFYTDGRTVYNRNHLPMPNGQGLLGNISSAQSSIVVPKPGSDSLYYIFTSDQSENFCRNGYNYSIVDITLNGGLGDVSIKNILLYKPGSERLTAVKHSNGKDIWIVTNVGLSNEFRSFLITCNGVSKKPVVSFSGEVIKEDLSYQRRAGHIKVSPDGKKLCQTISGNDIFAQLFDFDNATGMISNAMRLESQYPTFIGAEFSSDSKLLYLISPLDHNIAQYDVSVNDYNYILNSLIKIPAPESVAIMQMAPDGKIYITTSYSKYLHVINNPSERGLACNLQVNAVYLEGRESYLGLPNFMPDQLASRSTNFSFTNDSDCNTVHFFSLSNITGTLSYYWDFGDGTYSNEQNPVHTFSTGTGNQFYVKLTVSYSNECAGLSNSTVGKIINLNRIVPIAGFKFEHQCGNFTVQFFDTSFISSGGNISTRLWDFGDGNTSIDINPQHTYAITGNYQVKLTVGNSNTCGGSSSIIQTVSVESKPSPDFSFDKQCVNSPIQFTDQSTISAGTIQTWQWDFGDDSLSSDQNPVHTYSNPGNYIVSMFCASASGCKSDTSRKTITITSKPVADFSFTGNCFNQPTQFKDASSISNGNITQYYWNFNDGTTSTQTNPQHGYSLPGIYKVSLVSTSNTGCISDTITKTITIGSKPIADFSFNTSCGDKTVDFINTSSNTNEPINNYNWSFGDSNTSSIQSPSHTYNNFNQYNITLFVKSSIGCNSDTINKQIEIDPKPSISYHFSNSCINQSVLFSNNSFIESGNIVSWNWNFNDGTTSQNAQPIHIYNNAGDYNISFYAVSDKGCISDTIYQIINIESFPYADISINNSCVGSPLSIQNNSGIEHGIIQTHVWNFDNGTILNDVIPVYNYGQNGNYAVSYFAISKNGCSSDTIIKPLSIESIPVADFSYESACPGKPIVFHNLSQNDFGNIIQWNWNFDDGTSSTVTDPMHTFMINRQYNVSLKASTNNGCMGGKTVAINISKVNIFAGNDTLAAIDQPLQLQASGAAMYEWSPFLYLSNASIYNPIATVKNDMTYFLKGITAEGCIGYDTMKIQAYSGPAIYIPTAFTPNGDGRNDILKPILPGAYQLEYFTIYNRWGQQVFTTKELGKGWNGTFNGFHPEIGTYIWIIKVKDYTGKILEKNGTVVLIK